METITRVQDQLMETIHKAKEGDLSYLDACIELRKEKAELENSLAIIKEFEDEARELIEMEAKDYNNEYNGYKFEFRAGRKSFNFKGIPQWNEAEKRKKEVEAQAKAAFDLYQKTGAKPMTEDGEILELPEISYAKSSMVVKPVR